MTQTAQGWPFLVARGRRRGYRTILAPAFLTEQRLHGVLADAANGDHMDSRRARQVDVVRPDVGRLSLLYRTEQLTEAQLNGGSGDGLATDEHGRPLELLYGVVCRGRVHCDLEGADLDAARRDALASYRRFLAEEERFTVDASDAYPLPDVSVLPEPAPRPPDPVSERPPAPPVGRRIAAALAVALAALLAVVVLLRGGSGHVVDVRAAMVPAAALIDCTTPTTVTLEGSITTDGAAEVKYHWQTPGGPSEQYRLRFEDGETRPVLRVQYRTPTAAEDRYALVVEEPDQRSVQVANGVQCIGDDYGR